MGKLAKLVDGIKEKLLAGSGGGGDYGKLDKTGSMKVEIRSRRAQKLIAQNLAVADSIAGRSHRGGCEDKKKKKRWFFAF